jgi:hypothetical protein
VHSPNDGLAFIRQLVLHACRFDGRTPPETAEAVVVELESGPRCFPYSGSYYWSRNAHGAYCVTSALMALEAWGHRRIDDGEDVDVVIADILGDEEVPAAYLLVIVDLVLSHWPKSAKAAIPFVGCPELLSWDRTRSGYERIGFDFGAFGEEPRGLATRGSLKSRASRKLSLEQVVPFYTFAEKQADADALRVRLQNSVERLGSYEVDSNFSDPRLMAVYTLNQLDRANYQERQIQDADANARTGYLYVSPEVEANHLAYIQAQVTDRTASANLLAQVARVLAVCGKT